MLKKLMKIALGVAMVAATTTTAIAEMKISGLVRAYGGQISSSLKDATTDGSAGAVKDGHSGAKAHLTAHSQMNIKFAGGVDNTKLDEILQYRPEIIIVGGAITRNDNHTQSAQQLYERIHNHAD